MTAAQTVPADGDAPLVGARRVWSSPHAVPAAAALVAALDAIAFSVLALRGSWYADDLDFLAAGRAHQPDLGYLMLPVNDHLMPGLRLVYWAFAHLTPLNYPATVVFRALLILAANVAMYRLLVLLVGRRVVVLPLLAFYAFIPLTLPSDLSLSSAVNLLPTHVAGILLIDAAIRYAVGRRLVHAGLVALWLAVGLCFWEKSVLVLGTAAIVVGAVATIGSVRHRIATLIGMWQVWLPSLAVAAGFGWAWAATRDVSEIGGRELGGLSDITSIARTAWLESIAPAMIGGPWRWESEGFSYLGLADPPRLGVVIAQLAVAAGLVIAVRRTGRRALLAPMVVAVYVAGTAVILGLGRSDGFGGVSAIHFHYWSDLAIGLTLGLVLAMLRLDPARLVTRVREPDRIRMRRETRPTSRPDARTLRRGTAVIVVAVASVTVTSVSFVSTWDDNRAGEYLAAVERQLGDRPRTNVYDTDLPTFVMSPYLAQYDNLSDITPMMDVEVTFNGPSDPRLVTDDGTVVPARIGPSSIAPAGPTENCGYLVAGTEKVVIPLSEQTGPNTWFLEIGYLANPDAAVEVGVSDGLKPPVWLERTAPWPAGLSAVVLMTPESTDFDRVLVRGLEPDVNVCIGELVVGRPVPLDP